MIKLVLASRNKKKIEELRKLLSIELNKDVSVLSLDDIGYHNDIEEHGTTFEENAITKASVPAKLGYIGIADDFCYLHRKIPRFFAFLLFSPQRKKQSPFFAIGDCFYRKSYFFLSLPITLPQHTASV